MSNCKNCKHWTLSDSEIQGECNSKYLQYSAWGTDKDIEQSGLNYWDCEGYAAFFSTGPDFGCVHWKKIEELNTMNVEDKGRRCEVCASPISDAGHCACVAKAMDEAEDER